MKLLQNIAKNPQEDKFRKINGTNAKIQSTLFALSQTDQLLSLMGFVEIEPKVFVLLHLDMNFLSRSINAVDSSLDPIRM